MTLVIVGSATRPTGSDSYPPVAGTKVPYAYAQPIVDLDEQADSYGWPNLGIVGDVGHLKKHGGHTPWRAGSKRGVVWAMDRDMPASFTPWLVAKCASNYETRWLRFWNCDYKQFDNAGNYLGPSGDGHFHAEVEDGHENDHVTLFDDYAEENDMAGGLLPDERLWLRETHRVLVEGKRLNDPQTSTGPDGISRPIPWLPRALQQVGIDTGKVLSEVDTLEEGDAGILAAVRAIPPVGSGNIDTAAIVSELLEKLPPAVLDSLQDALSARPAS